MIVLYNGEYTDFDITTIPQWENRLKAQEDHYPQWAGKVYGDFEIVKIEYDWYLSTQRALLRCTHCGFEKYTNSPRAFRRGKGTSWKCDCQKPKKIEKPKKAIINYSDYVGEEINGFVSLRYTPGRGRGMLVCCTECMQERWAYGRGFLSGNITCNHTNKRDENVVGERFGDLLVIDQQGGVCICQCKCGFEKKIERYRLLNGTAKTCGRTECDFYISRSSHAEAAKRREDGLAFERKLQDVFERAGYEVIRTPDSGDYGVDFIVVIGGERWAFQCKKHIAPAGISAVFEVYAGGRFYDCTRFCVASPSGFTAQARRCAAKLGVQLEAEKFRFNVSLSENAAELLKTENQPASWKKERELTIDGVTKTISEWCKEYNVTYGQIWYRVRSGMSYSEALTYQKPRGRIKVEINGTIKTKLEWCEEYGVSVQLFDYRTKTRGMTPYEALTMPKQAKPPNPLAHQ